MQRRDEPIPPDLIDHLRKTIPGYRLESEQHQIELARMVWVGGSYRRQHKHFEGSMTFHYTELQASFGRYGFKAINERLGFFEVTKQWFKDSELTKGYRFTPLAQKSHDAYIKRRFRKDTELIIGSGIIMRTAPRAVAAKDKDNKTTTAWDHIKGNNIIAVNLPRLESLRLWLERKREDVDYGRSNGNLFSPAPSVGIIDRLSRETFKVIRMSTTRVAGRGNLMHRYEEATSGRLFARGVNLQNAPALIKQAALAGLMDYDFSNCHYAILRQMAARFGYECRAIDHYLANKSQVRIEIARQADIFEYQAKACLLMLLYGASQSEDAKHAIPEEIGIEAARRLYQVGLFADIAADIDKARAVILAGWEKRQRGGLVNDFGKTMKTSGATKPQMLAHLIQGVEAAALRVATMPHAQHIVLVQHDGFVATENLSNAQIIQIEDAIVDATGYRLELVKQQIQIDPDAYFLKNSNQNDLAVSANTGAGFSPCPAS